MACSITFGSAKLLLKGNSKRPRRRRRSGKIPNQVLTMSLLKLLRLIAVALLVSAALPRNEQAQDKCSDETADVKVTAEQRAKLDALQREMKPEFTFTIGDTGVLGHELTGAKLPDAASLRKQAEAQHELAKKAGFAALEKGPLPRTLDWLKRGKVSSIKCQWCQDCWAFASATAMESSIMIRENPSAEPNISEQAIVDCSGAGTCASGGWWADVFQYATNKSLPDEDNYPYAHSDSPCKTVGGAHYGIKIWDFVETNGGDPTVDALKRAIQAHGPIVVAIATTHLFDVYTSGVFNELPNDTSCTDHAVLIIGWDDSKHAWHIKNSWGKCCWGEHGFGWVAYGANHIGYEAIWVEAKKM
jgi:C1A family cysteine protease